MKTICFIRHAKSSWKDSSLRDIERPLNKRGLRDAAFMSQMIIAEGIIPDAIISSPANRAFTTASFFALAADIPKNDIVVENSIYESYAGDVLDMVTDISDEINTVFVFGHNPTFTTLVNMFLEEYLPNLPTCGIGKIILNIDSWEHLSPEKTLEAEIFYPKQYL